jgi:hypothetical protein
MDTQAEQMTEVLARLRAIEEAVNFLRRERTVKEWYSTAEAAELLGKAEFTVREWCRLGRLKAQKKQSGRGAYPAWTISAEEILRYRREGLLPFTSNRHL